MGVPKIGLTVFKLFHIRASKSIVHKYQMSIDSFLANEVQSNTKEIWTSQFERYILNCVENWQTTRLEYLVNICNKNYCLIFKSYILKESILKKPSQIAQLLRDLNFFSQINYLICFLLFITWAHWLCFFFLPKHFSFLNWCFISNHIVTKHDFLWQLDTIFQIVTDAIDAI